MPLSRRDAAAAQTFRRRQLVAVFLRGGRAESGAGTVPPPNRGLYGGVAVALVALLAVGVHSYLRGGPPRGWLADGHVVVDGDLGGRYLSVHGVLHPVPNQTSLLLLTRGTVPPHVTVSHRELLTAPLGAALGDADAPAFPPSLVEPARLVACVGRDGSLDVVIGPATPAPSAADGALVTSGSPAISSLLAAGRRHELASAQVLTSLSYEPAQQVAVPSPWLALFPTGSVLRPIRLPRVVPATGTSGVGSIVVDDSTRQEYVVTPSGLSLVRNRISALLLSGSPGSVRGAAHDLVVAARPAAPFGYSDVPDGLPSVAPAAATGDVVCTATDAAGPTTVARLPAAAGDVTVTGTLPAPVVRGRAAVAATGIAVHSPSGAGLLLRSTTAGGQLDDRHPDYLLADGRAHPVGDAQALSDLGYDERQAVRVPAAWLDLLPVGAALTNLAPAS